MIIVLRRAADCATTVLVKVVRKFTKVARSWHGIDCSRHVLPKGTAAVHDTAATIAQTSYFHRTCLCVAATAGSRGDFYSIQGCGVADFKASVCRMIMGYGAGSDWHSSWNCPLKW